MVFQRKRVYTALNADELYPGDKVIVAYNLYGLKEQVKMFTESAVDVIEVVQDEDYFNRFKIKRGESYPLAYLVERKENCTNCGEGRWDAEHQKIICNPVMCIYDNVVFRNHEIEVCEYWKPKAEQKAEKHTDCNHCEEAKKSYDHSLTNACPEKHYRPFKDTDELIKVWGEKAKATPPVLDMPYIWVRYKDKHIPQKGTLIRTFFEEAVSVDEKYLSLETLFKDYEFLDGSVCGVEE